MMDAVQAHYVDGKPRYLSDPLTSIFKILSEDEFDSLSDKLVQDILLRQHILIFGRKKPKYAFDPDGLETLAPLEQQIIIHGT